MAQVRSESGEAGLRSRATAGRTRRWLLPSETDGHIAAILAGLRVPTRSSKMTGFAEIDRHDITVVSRLGLALTVDVFNHPDSCVPSRVAQHESEGVAR
jgi:hypothetical protein